MNTDFGDLREVLMRTGSAIKIESKLDDGSWRTSEFANEPAAKEFEDRMRRREIETRRI